MGHAVLLGDSILDNGAYVSGGTPIHDQLRSRLPRDWRVTRLARDGSLARHVIDQLKSLPADASHLIVSAGGNDALDSTPVLSSPTPDSSRLIAELVEIQLRFLNDYREVIQALRQQKLPVVACTIYDAIPGLEPHERMALSLFNDVIVRQSRDARIPILDLRAVCNELRDYSSASPIEPSEIGGAKIARALHNILLGHDFTCPYTVMFP